MLIDIAIKSKFENSEMQWLWQPLVAPPLRVYPVCHCSYWESDDRPVPLIFISALLFCDAVSVSMALMIFTAVHCHSFCTVIQWT